MEPKMKKCGASHIYKNILLCCTALALLSGCADQPSEPTEIGEVTYKVISEGDSGAALDPDRYSKPVETEFIDVPDEMILSYGYEQLDKSGRVIYNLISDAMKNCQPTVEIPNVDRTGKLYNRVLELIRCENLGYFHLKSRSIGSRTIASKSFNIDFEYRYTAEEANTMLRKAETAADDIIMKITPDMTEYDKLKLFHDEIITGCKSSTDGEYADNIYGALVDGQALCEGYAKAFSYLCGRVGIENTIVTGYADEAHMWNMVKLDGNWYHVDLTWDHPDAALSAAYPDAVLYNYFLVSDADITDERTIDDSLFTPPRATGSVMNYFYHEGMYADSYEAALNAIESGCRNAAENGRHSFQIKLASDELYAQVLSDISVKSSNGRDTDITAAMKAAGFSGRISYTDLYSGRRILTFLLN